MSCELCLPVCASARRTLGRWASALVGVGSGRLRREWIGRVALVVCVGVVGGFWAVASARAAVWSVQPVAPPTGDGFGQLGAISCSAASSCVAVDAVVNESVTLAERWNGSAWLLQPTPASVSLGESQTSSLAGVSCLSRNACFAEVAPFAVELR